MPRIPRPVLLLGLAAAAIHLPVMARYGYFRDELYYLASTRHLDIGYVDHSPLSIWILAAMRALAGDSLYALRALPALAGGVVVILIGLTARDLGGGRFAQALAAVAALVAPVYLGATHYYSMNAFDLLFWSLAAWLLVRLVASGDARRWVPLGVVLGLGLLNKISVLWLGAGLAAGLLLTAHRRMLATRWPWIAAAIAAAIFAPYVVWQIRHDWATLEFMRNATERKMVETGLTDLVSGQVLTMNPLVAPIWGAGLIWCLFSSRGRPWRILAIAFLTVAAILAAGGASRASYLAPAYPLILAPGAIALERLLAPPRPRWMRWGAFALPAAAGALLAPFALPLLSADSFIRYQNALGVRPRQEETVSVAELPQHYADMFGWDEMARKAAAAYRSLTPQEQARCVFFGQNYGEAGALDVLGPRYGIPEGRVLSGHNSYWIWGARGLPADVAIILGGDYEDNLEFFETMDLADTIRCERCMPYERDLPVWIGRGPKRRLADVWSELRMFI